MKLTWLLPLLPTLALAQVDKDPRWTAFQSGRGLEQAYRQAGQANVQWSADSTAYGLLEGRNRVWRRCEKGEVIDPPAVFTPAKSFQSLRGRPIDSPDGHYRLYTQGNRVYLKGSGDPIALVPDAEVSPTVLCGNVPWVYGEELSQNAGMGWAPTGNHFWFYKFDSKPVPTYFLTQQLDLQSKLMELDYPKAGANNHLVEVWVGDAATGEAHKIDMAPRPGVEYLFDVRWISSDWLMFSRMDRLHKQREVAVYDTAKGGIRSLYKESDEAGYIPSTWSPTPIADKVFVPGDRGGFANWSRIDIRSGAIEVLGGHPFDVSALYSVNQRSMVYGGRGGANALANQLYSYDFRSKKATLLTNPGLHHNVSVSPNGEYFFDSAQDPNHAPELGLFKIGATGARLLRKHERPAVAMLPAPATAIVPFVSADGKTALTGLVSFPPRFDPAKKYPVLFDVYGGPERSDVSLAYQPYRALTELGFLVVQAETRGAVGRGAAFRDAGYTHLGITEIDDFAAFAKKLREFPYVDSSKVAIFGTSYGGYASLMALLRYPDVFQAASSSSPPTDWRNYDSIYTERFMGLPKDQKAAYDAGNVLTYAGNLKGALQLYFGTSDDNVHPSNSLQLIRELERLGKDYELRVGPDRGHSYVGDRHLVQFLLGFIGN